MFLTYQSHLPAPLKALGEVVAKHWITFASGGDPWTPYSHDPAGESKVMLYGQTAEEIAEKQKKTYESVRVAESLQDGISTFAMAMRGMKQ